MPPEKKQREENPMSDPYLFLAYDHGLGRGPEDFKEYPQGADPAYVIDLAREGKFSAIALEPGLAWLYRDEIQKQDVSLLVKVNGRTNFFKDSFFAPQLCTVEYAVETLNATALGAVVFLGDPDEARMLRDLGHIVEAATQYRSDKKLPVVGWMYVLEDYKQTGPGDPKRMAYAARVGAELGCDIVKVHWTGDAESFSWVCEAAGKTKVVVAGGTKTNTPEEFLGVMKEARDAGAAGVAVGRNIWQVSREEALKTAQQLHKIFSEK